jgi:ferredoxin-nitrite reductase
MSEQGFSEEQKQYLDGFLSGIAAKRGSPPPAAPAAPPAPDLHRAAQDRFTAAGRKLTPEEEAKRKSHPLDMWDELLANAEAGRFPKGTDIFRHKFFGLFYVAPAQDSFMCRLRLPNGIVTAHQLAGLADLAERLGGGSADVTTRANLQIREIGPRNIVEMLVGLQELGLTSRGAGADNIRNITGSPTAGIDAQELIDTRPLARALHHYILNHRELYGLPRKFNIGFDGGGAVSVLEDTNDIGFAAVSVTPAECISVATAVVRVFIAHGDRTDRKRARLKYLLDDWGLEKFLAAVEAELGRALTRLPLDSCTPRAPRVKHAHIGIHRQRQEGLSYIGVALPVGRLAAAQMRGLAAIAQTHGSGTIRLTVWQNLILSDIAEEKLAAAAAAIEALGLGTTASPLRGGLVACTGNTGCKFAATDTKSHARMLADALDGRLPLDLPLNIHLTGCPNSCAQHYVGDIGLLGAKLGEEMIEGYAVLVGGGAGEERTLAREIYPQVPVAALPETLERMLAAYLGHRRAGESFHDFAARHSVEELTRLFAAPVEIAA